MFKFLRKDKSQKEELNQSQPLDTVSPQTQELSQEPESAKKTTYLEDSLVVEKQETPQSYLVESTQLIEESVDLIKSEAVETRSLFSRLKRTFKPSSQSLTGQVQGLFKGKKLGEDWLTDLEDILILSDLGVLGAQSVLQKLEKRRFDKNIDEYSLRMALAEVITSELIQHEKTFPWPDRRTDNKQELQVIFFLGVNGSGKTTSLGKLALQARSRGLKVLIAAADTFRTAAIDQLETWGERSQVPVYTKEHGADPASVVYEAIEKAMAEQYDLVLIDTAGRLQNKNNLMQELQKMTKVAHKLTPQSEIQTLLVLDGTVGQNAINQYQGFDDVASLTGLIVTKLDGTAKAGVILALMQEANRRRPSQSLPLYWVGCGESLSDLYPFKAEEFAKALLDLDSL